jgi:hypothetical protein
MPLSTYDELQSAILNWLARAPDDEDAVVDTIKDFITLAEVRFNQELRVRQMVERVAAPINEVQESVPARFLEPISASIIMSTGNIYPLRYVTAHELSRGGRNVEGDPACYTIIGGQILFAPVIRFDDTISDDDRPQMELVGYFSQPVLSETNPDNDILKFYPQIYLYGALLEASAFVTADQLATWAGAYAEAVDKANTLGQNSQFESVAQEPPPHYAVIG